MAHGTYDNPRAGSSSSKNRMGNLINKVNGDGGGDNKFYNESVSKTKKKGIHKIGKLRKVFETGDVIYKTKEKKLSTDTDSGKFYVTKSKTHLTKSAPGVKTPFIEKTVKEKTKLVSAKKAAKIDARMHKKNLKKDGADEITNLRQAKKAVKGGMAPDYVGSKGLGYGKDYDKLLASQAYKKYLKDDHGWDSWDTMKSEGDSRTKAGYFRKQRKNIRQKSRQGGYDQEKKYKQVKWLRENL